MVKSHLTTSKIVKGLTRNLVETIHLYITIRIHIVKTPSTKQVGERVESVFHLKSKDLSTG